jgi:hypothetical protein
MYSQIYAITCKTWNSATMQYEYLCFDVTHDAGHSMQIADEAEHAFERASTERALVYVQ